jgi:hypothetical protein
MKITKLITLTIVSILFLGCNNKELIKYDIDLTVKYADTFKSIKIDKEGNGFYFVQKLNKLANVYKFRFSTDNVETLNNKLSNIAFAECERLINVSDGLQYNLLLDKKNIYSTVGACPDLKVNDSVVELLIELTENIEKEKLFTSYSTMVAPEFPETTYLFE